MGRGFEVCKGFEDKEINMPVRKTARSAGYDMEAAEDIVVPKFSLGAKPTLIPTGLKAYMQYLLESVAICRQHTIGILINAELSAVYCELIRIIRGYPAYHGREINVADTDLKAHKVIVEAVYHLCEIALYLVGLRAYILCCLVLFLLSIEQSARKPL